MIDISQTCIPRLDRNLIKTVKAKPLLIQDRSRADFAVARKLVILGFVRVDVIAVLLHGSVKAGEMNRDRAMYYVNRTVDRAFGFVVIS